jgi:hypothetical protein
MVKYAFYIGPDIALYCTQRTKSADFKVFNVNIKKAFKATAWKYKSHAQSQQFIRYL